jgi:hypothetical protein
MKWLALALMLVLGLAQGYPLYGSNGAVDCTIFGTFKDPIVPGNANSYQVLLYFDLSLVRNHFNNSSAVEAVYSLTDGNHRVYNMRAEYTKELQPQRWLIGFLVPKEAIARSLTIDPSADPSAGDQFNIDMGDLINASNENATAFYYGILSSTLASNRRSIEMDVGLTNNDTSKLSVSAKNWTLLDQWGWKYNCQRLGSSDQRLAALVLEPNQTIRSILFFPKLSPLSRPTKLVYLYSNSSSLILDIDTESGLLVNLTVPQEECDCCSQGQAQVEDPSTLAGSIKASKARLAKVRENLNTTS